MTFRPTTPLAQPWFESKLRKGAIASVAVPTGTPKATTYATSSVTLAQLAGYVMQLVTDLQTRGVITTH